MTSRTWLGAAALCVAALSTGCALQAPPYQASISNVSAIKRGTTQSARVGDFSAQPGAVGAVSISMRGSSMTSPVGENYAAYLAQALERDLALAQRLDPKSPVVIQGTLLGTDIDAAMGTGKGFMEARFVVLRDGQVQFDKVKRGTHSWDSSFAAAVALPAAQQAYAVVVQNLLASLFTDADFQASLK